MNNGLEKNETLLWYISITAFVVSILVSIHDQWKIIPYELYNIVSTTLICGGLYHIHELTLGASVKIETKIRNIKTSDGKFAIVCKYFALQRKPISIIMAIIIAFILSGKQIQ